MKAEYIGQITKYINYVDKNIKELFNDKTVGVLYVKKRIDLLWSTAVMIEFYNNL